MQETPETRAKLAQAIKTLQAKGDTSTIDKLVTAYKEKYQPPTPERNIGQKILGSVLDPIAKLGAEAGQALATPIVKTVEAFQSSEKKAQTEKNFQSASNKSIGSVPILGTPVKAQNKVTARDVAGQAIQAAATFAPGASAGASLGRKVLAGAATGYGFDVGQKLEDSSKTLKQAATPGVGTVVGGAIPLASAGISSITKNLPKWFVQKALPKLNPENTDIVLNQTHLGSIKSMAQESEKAVSSYGKAIDEVLSKPQYKDAVGNGAQAIGDTLSQFANADLTEKKVVGILKQVAPAQKTLIDKVANGTATLAEKNTLRSTIDQAIYPKFTDTPSLTFNKKIGKAFTDSLRSEVQKNAPETGAIFKFFSKEINLRNALKAAQAKIVKGAPVGLYDLMGYAAGHIPGVIGEKAARSPAVLTAAAKGISALQKVKTGGVSEILKKGILKSVSSQK